MRRRTATRCSIISLAHAVNPWLYKLPYDPIKAFTPIAILASGPNVLVVNPGAAGQVGEGAGRARQEEARQAAYASAGVGSFQHLGGELFKLAAGVNILHVPFKGGGPAMIDVIGGHTKVMFSSLVQTTPQIQSGKLRALGVGGKPAQPDPAGRADHRRGRRARLRGGQLVGHRGAGRHCRRRSSRSCTRRLRPSRTSPRCKTQFANEGADVVQDEPGRVRQVHGDGNEQVGARREGKRHQGGIARRPRHPGADVGSRLEQAARPRSARRASR